MHTDRAVASPSSEQVAMRPTVDRQTPVKTLPSLAVVNNWRAAGSSKHTLETLSTGTSQNNRCHSFGLPAIFFRGGFQFWEERPSMNGQRC